FGSPMDFSKYSGLPSDRFLLRSVTDEIMYEIMRLSGQEYVDTYASTVKTKLLTSAKPKKTDSARDDAKNSAKKPKDSAPQGDGRPGRRRRGSRRPRRVSRNGPSEQGPGMDRHGPMAAVRAQRSRRMRAPKDADDMFEYCGNGDTQKSLPSGVCPDRTSRIAWSC